MRHSNCSILLFLAIAGVSFLSIPGLANNIRIQKVSLADTNRTDKTVAVKFNISWEHSWRDETNWDAAWVFLKFREPKDSSWRWRHANLSKTGNDPGISNVAMKLAVPDDFKGAFYYRQNSGSGNVQSADVTLLWKYGSDGVTKIDSVELKIFATEMVYVPEGQFCLGHGNGSVAAISSLALKQPAKNYVTVRSGWTPTFLSFNGDGPNPIDIGDITIKQGIRVSGLLGLDVNNDNVAEHVDYPTGFRAFYTMKYKVTQGQYTDFLNSLTLNGTDPASDADYLTEVPNLDPFYNQSVPSTSRFTIKQVAGSKGYSASRPDRAFGGLKSPVALFAFADWAGLRPMTEMEFEKAARGPLPPTTADNIWGPDSTNLNNATALPFSGAENGTEYFVGYNHSTRAYNPTTAGPWTNGDDNGNGPGLYRVGIFANDTTGRSTAAASYYGIMDMTKNGYEATITLRENFARANFSWKTHGDGMLNIAQAASEFLPHFSGDLTYYWRFALITKGYGRIAEAVEKRNGPGTNEVEVTSFRCVRTAPAD